ncbi:MAG: UbiA prenyltransferase family protein [Candidatus Woesearchaeota archaeon]
MIAKLLRVKQWYKNLVIFLPIIFGQQLGNTHALWLTLIGFFALCFVSSANYIINDIADRKADMHHPEKRMRPIASGKVKGWQGIVAVILLLIVASILSIALSRSFLYFLAGLFALGQLYTFLLRKEAFLDIMTLGSLFVLRAVSGSYIISSNGKPYIWVSPWLILCPFFLSLFLSAGKREADIMLLGNKASLHKQVMEAYSKKVTGALTLISTTLLVTSYSFYSFLTQNERLAYTLPIALYVIFRYLYLIETGNVIARSPENFYKDKRLTIGIIVWIATLLSILYFI